MIFVVNEKHISSFNVSKDGTVIRNPEVVVSGIIKSDNTAKKIVAEKLGVPASTLVVTETVAVEQHYEIDDDIFFANAVKCEPQRKKRNADTDTAE